MKNKLSIVSLFFMALAGCGQFYPKAPVPYDNGENGGLPINGISMKSPPVNYADSKLFAEKYYNFYYNEVWRINNRSNTFDDFKYFGALVGVLAGAIGAESAAVGGGSLAAGASIFPDRYQFKIQENNLASARDGYFCILTKLRDFPSDKIDEINKFSNSNGDKNKSIGDLTYAKIGEITEKLSKAQLKTDLMYPDVGAIEDALKKRRDVINIAAILGKKNPIAGGAETYTISNGEVYYKELEAEMNVCVASLSQAKD